MVPEENFNSQFPLLTLDTSKDIMTQLYTIRTANPINSQMAMDTDHAIFKISLLKSEMSRQQTRKLIQQIQTNTLELKLKPNQFFSTSLFDKPIFWTPLHCACYYGKLQVVKQLLNCGYDITLRDQWYGSFPLAWAAYNNHVEVCLYLIEHGASIHQTNFYHQTAFDMAVNPLHPKWYFLFPNTCPETIHCLDILQILKDQSKDNRTLIDMFIQLPNKEIYPSYYVQIKSPLSISHVETKLIQLIKSNVPYSPIDFHTDMLLIFRNALEFNVETSLIYKDALTLQHVFIKQIYTKLNISTNCNGILQWDNVVLKDPFKKNSFYLLTNHHVLHLESLLDGKLQGQLYTIHDKQCTFLKNTTIDPSLVAHECCVLGKSEYSHYHSVAHDSLFYTDTATTYPIYLLKKRTVPIDFNKPPSTLGHYVKHAIPKPSLPLLTTQKQPYQPSFGTYHHYKPPVQRFKPYKPQTVQMSQNMIEIEELDKLHMLDCILIDCGENFTLFEIDTTSLKSYCITIPEITTIHIAPLINKQYYTLLREASEESPFRQRVNFDFVQYYLEVNLNGNKCTSHMVDMSRSMIKLELRECMPNMIYYPGDLKSGYNLITIKTVFRVMDYEQVINKSDSGMDVNEMEQKNTNMGTRPVFRYQNEEEYVVVVNSVVN